MEFEAPNEEMVYGNGSFSGEILSFAPADPIFSLGFAMKLVKFTQFFERKSLESSEMSLKWTSLCPNSAT